MVNKKTKMNKIKNTISRLFFNHFKSFLNKKGKTIIPLGSEESLISFYNEFRTKHMLIDDGIVSLVFSKDRAMQLHAFLSSYFENIENYSQMIVLYKASNDDFRKSYQELKPLFSTKPVIFVEETNFREQLIELISSSLDSRIVFYVDDMIFTQKFDYLTLLGVNPFEKIVALSRGRDMTYSVVIDRHLHLPKFKDMGNGLLEFAWNDIQEFSDWTYPLGVSGYMFATDEVAAIIKSIPFKAPNSLEISMQRFLPLFKDRKGICTENAVSVCVHANLTQTEVKNPVLGNFTLEELNDKWLDGYQINYKEFFSKPMEITQSMDYNFIVRSQG